MSENTDPLLPREAQEPSPIVPRIHIRALRLGDDSVGLQVRELMEGDRLRERKKELPRLQDLHREQGLPGEPREVSL